MANPSTAAACSSSPGAPEEAAPVFPAPEDGSKGRGCAGPVPQGSELILITTAHSSDARGPPKGWGGAVKTRNNSPSEDCNELNQHRIMFEKHQPTEVSTLLPSSRIC